VDSRDRDLPAVALIVQELDVIRGLSTTWPSKRPPGRGSPGECRR